MNFIDELKDILVSETDLIFGTDIFIGKLPDTLTKIICLSKSTSPKYQYNLGDKFGYQEENIVIRIRGNQTENETREMAENIENILENITNTTLNDFRIIRGYFSTPLYQLEGTDENNNYIYVGVYTSILERI